MSSHLCSESQGALLESHLFLPPPTCCHTFWLLSLRSSPLFLLFPLSISHLFLPALRVFKQNPQVTRCIIYPPLTLQFLSQIFSNFFPFIHFCPCFPFHYMLDVSFVAVVTLCLVTLLPLTSIFLLFTSIKENK